MSKPNFLWRRQITFVDFSPHFNIMSTFDSSIMTTDKQTQVDAHELELPPTPITSSLHVPPSNHQSLQVIYQQDPIEQISSSSHPLEPIGSFSNQSEMQHPRRSRRKSRKQKEKKEKEYTFQRTVQIRERRVVKGQEQILKQCLIWSKLMQPIAHDLHELGEKQVAEQILNTKYLQKDPLVSQQVKQEKKKGKRIRKRDVSANQQDVNLQQMKKEREKQKERYERKYGLKYEDPKSEKLLGRRAFSLRFYQQDMVHFCDSDSNREIIQHDQDMDQMLRF